MKETKRQNTASSRAGKWRLLMWSALVAAALAFGTELFEGRPAWDVTELVAAEPRLRLNTQSLLIEEFCDSLSGAPQPLAAASRPIASERFRIDASTTLAASSSNGSHTTLRFSAATIAEATGTSRLTLTNLPINGERPVDLELERFSVFTGGAEFIAKDGVTERRYTEPEGAYFRGHVTGDPSSTVFLGVSPYAINGFVSSRGTIYSIASGPSASVRADAGLTCTVMDAETLPMADFACNVAALDPLSANDVPFAAASASEPEVGLRECRMALIGDYEYFQEMGADLNAATVYLAQLLAAVSTIYERDLRVALVISYVEIWTDSNDPFSLCAGSGLEEFRLYGDAKLRGHAWNLAFKMSGCGGGGLAFLNAMCFQGGERGVSPYATGRIQGFFPSPVVPAENVVDLYIVAHEIGHNFSTPHTHCYTPPIDRCYNKENSCYDGDTVCSRGTIMSYCNRCPGGLANFDLEFHPRVIQQIAPVIQGSCLRLAASSAIVYSDDAGVVTVDSVRSTATWMSPGRSAFRVEPYDSITIPLHLEWDEIREAENYAQLLIYSSDDPVASPLVLEVTAIRRRPRADFTASLTKGCWPLTVDFTDLSTNSPRTWLWQFGDNDSSLAQNPSHTYTTAGNYKVTLNATNECGTHVAPRSITVQITEPAACCTTSTIVVTKNHSVLQAIDLWECNGEPDLLSEDIRYVISTNPEPACGALIGGNRYLNVYPNINWFGRSDVRIASLSPDGCRCETAVSIVINDPPSVTLSTPPAGTTITNRPFSIRWEDSDQDHNAGIRLYYTGAEGCAGGVAINTEEILEDQGGSRGEYLWRIAGVPDGLYRIRAVIRDQYIEAASCSPGTLLLDQTPPVTEATYTCLDEEQLGWCHGDVVVELTATDNLTGVDGVFYSLNRGPWQVYTAPVVIRNVGKTLIEYYAIDIAGNVEAARASSPLVQIDRAAPRVERFYSDNPNFRSGDYTTDRPSFSILISDDGVGLDPASIDIKVAPGTAAGDLHLTEEDENVVYNTVTRRVSLTTPVSLLPGPQNLTITLADALGNVATASTDFIVGAGMNIRDVINFPNPFNQDTRFTFTLTQHPRDVRIRIYDLSGVLMRELVTADVHEGYNEVYWDGLSDGGITLANGAYLYEIIATGEGGTSRHHDKLAILR